MGSHFNWPPESSNYASGNQPREVISASNATRESFASSEAVTSQRVGTNISLNKRKYSHIPDAISQTASAASAALSLPGVAAYRKRFQSEQIPLSHTSIEPTVEEYIPASQTQDKTDKTVPVYMPDESSGVCMNSARSHVYCHRSDQPSKHLEEYTNSRYAYSEQITEQSGLSWGTQLSQPFTGYSNLQSAYLAQQLTYPGKEPVDSGQQSACQGHSDAYLGQRPTGQPVGLSAVLSGTQQNPLEIPSSPETKPKKPKNGPKQPAQLNKHAKPDRNTTSSKKSDSFPYVPLPSSQNSRTSLGTRKTAGLANHLSETPVRNKPVQEQFTSSEYSDLARVPANHARSSSRPLDPVVQPPVERRDLPSCKEPVLVSEQQHVVDLILEGHNVFYTGSAGCGKSTILKAFVGQLRERGLKVQILAPTNLAALNVDGQTTWNFAGWTPDSMKKPLKKLKNDAFGNKVHERLVSVDVLVIDEISMIENLQFERLNEVMKYVKDHKNTGKGAFGGTQVVVTGDFFQLSPVKPFAHCIGCGWELIKDHQSRPQKYQCENRYCKEDFFNDIDKWAFRSEAWKECNFKHVNLTEIHRQSDKMFISILNKIRTEGKILRPHANVLLNHTSETEGAIKLFARRDEVDEVNRTNIRNLPSKAHTYKCVDTFTWREEHKDDHTLEKNTRRAENGMLSVLKDHRYEGEVDLKEGQRVVLQQNLEPTAGLVNGSQGSIVQFEPYNRIHMPKTISNKEKGKAEMKDGAQLLGTTIAGSHAAHREEQIHIFAKENKYKPWPVVRFDNGLVRTIFPDCTVSELGNEEPYSLLSRAQIPLTAGYAITVHKSQGMSLDRVIVNLSRSFEQSQIYVALSRARSLRGLTVVGLPRHELGGANPQVKEFYEAYLKK